jgi:hypothetical protein
VRPHARGSDYLKRRLLNLLTALSLLLCVAVVAVWVRSWFHGDTVGWSLSHPRDANDPDAPYPSRRSAVWLTVIASNGRLGVLYSRYYGEATPPLYGSHWQYRRTDPSGELEGVTWAKLSHFAQVSSVPSEGYIEYQAYVRLWPLAVLTAVPPALRAWRTVRRRRAAGPGKCSHCGYDLRATPERCPECGTMPQADPAR